MKDLEKRLGFITPKGTYPTVFNDNTYSYYEQICALVKVIAELNDEINDMSDSVSEIQTELDGKQDVLTFDTAPTPGSTNPVTSNGIAAADTLITNMLLEVQRDLIQRINGKQDTLIFDTEPTYDSTNPVTSGGIYTAIHDAYTTLQNLINGKQDTLTFDTEPTNQSTNPVTSGGIYTAMRSLQTALSGEIDNKQDKLIVKVFDIDSADWILDGSLYKAKQMISGLTTTSKMIYVNPDNTINISFACLTDGELTMTTINSAVTTTDIYNVQVLVIN